MYSEQAHYIVCKLKEMASELGRTPSSSDFKKSFPNVSLEVLFGSHDKALAAAGLLKEEKIEFGLREPKILVFDIECKPIKAWAWGLFDQNIGIDMIIEDWSVMSWAAKWLGKPEIFYQDVSVKADVSDDRDAVAGLWDLLNECDYVITQNGKKFDVPKISGKFAEYGLGPPKPFKHVDTLQIAKKLGLTSKKLAFMTDKFNKTHKKLTHSKFPGITLWLECMKGNSEAWAEMKEYNIYDVLSTEELYVDHLMKWDTSSPISFGAFTGVYNCCPKCGNEDLEECGLIYTKTGAFQNFKCKKCGSHSSSKDNLLTKSIKKGLMK